MPVWVFSVKMLTGFRKEKNPYPESAVLLKKKQSFLKKVIQKLLRSQLNSVLSIYTPTPTHAHTQTIIWVLPHDGNSMKEKKNTF